MRCIGPRLHGNRKSHRLVDAVLSQRYRIGARAHRATERTAESRERARRHPESIRPVGLCNRRKARDRNEVRRRSAGKRRGTSTGQDRDRVALRRPCVRRCTNEQLRCCRRISIDEAFPLRTGSGRRCTGLARLRRISAARVERIA